MKIFGPYYVFKDLSWVIFQIDRDLTMHQFDASERRISTVKISELQELDIYEPLNQTYIVLSAKDAVLSRISMTKGKFGLSVSNLESFNYQTGDFSLTEKLSPSQKEIICNRLKSYPSLDLYDKALEIKKIFETPPEEVVVEENQAQLEQNRFNLLALKERINVSHLQLTLEEQTHIMRLWPFEINIASDELCAKIAARILGGDSLSDDDREQVGHLDIVGLRDYLTDQDPYSHVVCFIKLMAAQILTELNQPERIPQELRIEMQYQYKTGTKASSRDEEETSASSSTPLQQLLDAVNNKENEAFIRGLFRNFIYHDVPENILIQFLFWCIQRIAYVFGCGRYQELDNALTKLTKEQSQLLDTALGQDAGSYMLSC